MILVAFCAYSEKLAGAFGQDFDDLNLEDKFTVFIDFMKADCPVQEYRDRIRPASLADYVPCIRKVTT